MTIPIFQRILQSILHLKGIKLFEIPNLHIRKNYFHKISYFFLFRMSIFIIVVNLTQPSIQFLKLTKETKDLKHVHS